MVDNPYAAPDAPSAVDGPRSGDLPTRLVGGWEALLGGGMLLLAGVGYCFTGLGIVVGIPYAVIGWRVAGAGLAVEAYNTGPAPDAAQGEVVLGRLVRALAVYGIFGILGLLVLALFLVATVVAGGGSPWNP